MADFLHKKKNSSIWYYRRRYPQEVARILSKHVFMLSLKTSVKRDAEKLARKQSVAFDEFCEKTLREYAQAQRATKGASEDDVVDSAQNPQMSLTQLRARGYEIVVELQKQDSFGWESKVTAYKDFFENMKRGCVPKVAQRPAIEAQAVLNGMDLALRGEPLPDTLTKRDYGGVVSALANGTWEDLCQKALNRYRDRVSNPRYQLAITSLKQITVVSTATADVEDALRAWAKSRLECVSPRTVKNQLTCVTSTLREVMPSLKAPTSPRFE